ncbi:MAG: O-antigen ligase family protein [Gammaproteobacteria bacterium]|jgi:O-antigen ligase|nr:O-antigen ligase family protein [Gammaproteobacteria bacterium]MBT4654511.1 O-antigen ligase family protein [Gammaproteobacteria bacterium]MBT5116771.1 O-antigen ligase family protein [Gammaproteobacteria bacterium]MBT5761452.1 O-antigen ligase family protein [Gammaproteobacteria bacterium]MBT6332015.1 O-antigen ligase family protein [Gammaproteobacteria bacterium]
MEHYSESDTFFRTPSTPLRIFLFSISASMLILIPLLKLPTISYESKHFKIITKYLIVVFMLSILSTENLYNIAALILLFISIIYLIFFSSKKFSLLEKYFLSSYFLIFYYPFLHSFFIETNLAEMDNSIRFLFAIPVYCLIREMKINEEYFKFIVNHTSLTIGLFAIYFSFSHESLRVSGYTSTATIFGNIALLFSCLSLLSMKSFNHKFFKYYPLISGIIAFYAWSLTGSRSSLLILPVFLTIFLFSKDIRSNFLFKVDLKSLTMFFVVMAIIFSQSTVFNRMVNSYESSYSYLFENGEYNWRHKDSLVPRLTIWKGSTNIISEYPLLGIGQSNFNNHLVLQIKDKKINPIRNSPEMLAAGLNHAHNQYLDTFAKTGIIGFIILIFFIYMNLLFFSKKYVNNRNCFYSKAGLFTIISYSTYMLNHTILSHQQSSLFLSFFLIIVAALANNNILKEKV